MNCIIDKWSFIILFYQIHHAKKWYIANRNIFIWLCTLNEKRYRVNIHFDQYKIIEISILITDNKRYHFSQHKCNQTLYVKAIKKCNSWNILSRFWSKREIFDQDLLFFLHTPKCISPFTLFYVSLPFPFPVFLIVLTLS